MLGRFEYQKGNIEAALHVFEGIDIAAITPKMKTTLIAKVETHKRRSHNYAIPSMSIHAVSLLLEAVFLKTKSLQILRRYKGNFGLKSISLSWTHCSSAKFMRTYHQF